VSREHLRIIIPLRKNHEENKAVLRQELKHNGVSVIVARRECIQTASKNRKAEAAEKNKTGE
jgi:indolepyruvate ferredoxin oxidoreductase alpha subunit